MLDVLHLILPIVLPILAGAAIVRLGLLSRAESHVLSLFFLYLAVPSLLIRQLARQDLRDLYDPSYVVAFLLVTAGLYGGVFVVERYLLKRDRKASALAAFAGAKFNAVILGLPILQGTLGEAASGPLIVNVILGYFSILPLTVALIGDSSGEAGRNPLGRLAGSLGGVLKDPLVLSALVGMVLAASQIRLPGWLDGTLQSLGAAAVPTALVASGMALSLSEIEQNVGEVVWISAVRGLISPALAVAVALVIGLSPIFAIALVLSFGIATAQMVVPLAERAGTYRSQAAAVVALTTLAMVAALPILIWVCSRLWPGPMVGPL